MPARSREAVTESGLSAARSEGVRFLRMEEGYAIFEIGSGIYRFASEAFPLASGP